VIGEYPVNKRGDITVLPSRITAGDNFGASRCGSDAAEVISAAKKASAADSMAHRPQRGGATGASTASGCAARRHCGASVRP
jgi:hypothetical protein